MLLPDGLLIAAILIVVCALIGPAIFAKQKARPARDFEAEKAAEAAKRLFAARVGLTFSVLFLSDRIARMRVQALALVVADDDDLLSDLAREKRIILEQVRIADSHSREITVALAKFDENTLEAVRWPFTAAELQLSFAQKRLDRWPDIDSTTDKRPV
ncbi:hypothetical protein BH11CYA1_BH11CYA1_38490 [soil metagenome]